MTTVTLATYCHLRDLPRLHAPGELQRLVDGHNYPFDEVIVIHQRCGTAEYRQPTGIPGLRIIDIHEMDYPAILGRFGIPHRDPALSELTHGWNGPHYYEHHNVNHCKVLTEAKSDYIVFNDADCHIIAQPEGRSWIDRAVEILETIPAVFIVAPSEGGAEFDQLLPDGTRLTQTVSQQLFIGNRARLLEMDFTDLPFDGKFDAPYGPMQEFYGMFEGHLWRWMRKHGLYRAVLPPQWRYWHGAYH